MADTFLFTIAENVLGEIGSLTLEQVCLAWGLESNKKKLEEKLLTIKAVLLDAEEKKAKSRELRMWLDRLKDFLYDAEDMLDEFEYERLHKQVAKEYGSTKTKVCSFFSRSNPLVFRFKIGHKIKKLRKRLDEIADEKSKFHLTGQFTYGLGEHMHRERDCPRLLSLPDSFRCLTNLQELKIVNCPQLSERCQPEIGQDWPKIAHVPHIYLDQDIGLLAGFKSDT